MTVDRRFEAFFVEMTQKSLDARGGEPPADLKGRGGDGTLPPMEDRVVRLETHFEYVRKDLDAISAKLDRLAELPTRNDLRSWQWQWIATGVGIIALTVGGITGGLALIARFAG